MHLYHLHAFLWAASKNLPVSFRPIAKKKSHMKSCLFIACVDYKYHVVENSAQTMESFSDDERPAQAFVWVASPF